MDDQIVKTAPDANPVSPKSKDNIGLILKFVRARPPGQGNMQRAPRSRLGCMPTESVAVTDLLPKNWLRCAWPKAISAQSASDYLEDFTSTITTTPGGCGAFYAPRAMLAWACSGTTPIDSIGHFSI